MPRAQPHLSGRGDRKRTPRAARAPCPAGASTPISVRPSRSRGRNSIITTGRDTWRIRPGSPAGRSGRPRLEALEAEIFAAWGEYTFHARLQGETPNCAGFDVERARLFKAGATAVGFDDEDELAQLTDGGMDLSGRRVAVVIPPEALRVLGSDWALRHETPQVELRTSLIPDWEFPGYWLLKDNRAVSAAEFAELLVGRPDVSERELQALRGGITVR